MDSPLLSLDLSCISHSHSPSLCKIIPDKGGLFYSGEFRNASRNSTRPFLYSHSFFILPQKFREREKGWRVNEAKKGSRVFHSYEHMNLTISLQRICQIKGIHIRICTRIDLVLFASFPRSLLIEILISKKDSKDFSATIKKKGPQMFNRNVYD